MPKKATKIALLCLGASILIGGVATAATACSSAATSQASNSNAANQSSSHPTTNTNHVKNVSPVKPDNNQQGSSPQASHPASPETKPSVSPSSSSTPQPMTKPVGVNHKHQGVVNPIPTSHPTSKPVVKPSTQLPVLTWSNPNHATIDVANLNSSLSLNVSGAQKPLLVSYYLTCTNLNLNNYLLDSNRNNAFCLNADLASILATAGSYFSASIIAKTQFNNQTISSKPLTVVFYNSNVVKATANQQKLFWIPVNNNQIITSTVPESFKLLTNYSLPQGDTFVLNATVQNGLGTTTTFQQNLNPESDNTFNINLSAGYQNLQLTVVNSSKQIVAVSNILTVNAQNQNYIHLTANNLENNTVAVQNGSATLTVYSNLSGFNLNPSDIYYQNVNTNNQWVSLATKSPEFFNIQISNNAIQISDFYTNFATNIKVVDPTTQCCSQILTLSSYVDNGGYQTNVYANGDLIKDNSYTTNKNQVTLKFVTNIDAKLLNYQVAVFQDGAWQNLKLINDTYNFQPQNKGTYNFRIITNWTNNIVSPIVTSYFNINLASNLSSSTINSYTSKLKAWSAVPQNILNVYKEFLKNNPAWLMGYITNWGFGWQLSLSNNNINTVLDNWSLSVNKNNQLVLQANIKTSLAMAAYGRNGVKNFGAGDTLYIGLPLFTTSNQYETISASVNNLGYSYLNFKLNFTSFNNTSTFSWAITDKSKHVVNQVNYNLSALSSSVATSLTLTHYSADAIPQYISDLNPLSNKANQ